MAEIFWVLDTPLAILLCPLGTHGSNLLRDEMRAYKDGGIQTVVSLLTADQVTMLGLEKEGQLATKLKMQFINFPIVDHSVPQNLPEFRALVTQLAEHINRGERVGLHCWGSVGRAPLTAACIMIHLGWKAADAIAALSLSRGCQVPEMDEQREWILAYEAQG